MRAGLSTIQQTLTPEAASVLNQSIAEAGRRNHGQTTPLHVAATLLASSSGYLRQACIRSHPNSSHPLQCRALELCFSVALERLPSAQNISPGLEPPISNALMAALKRAQANQRRGCPEQQQQPLLAVKVELEQLIISILDDPSVSRVMREASFSSPAVKATIEQSINSANSSGIGGGNGLGFRPGTTAAQLVNRNLYLNPRLQTGVSEQSTLQRRGEVRRLIDIMLREKKRNPVLVGDSEPKVVLQELFQRIENREISEGLLRNVVVVFLEKEFGSDKSQIIGKLKGLGSLVDARISSTGGSGVILDLGDLKWLVEQPPGLGVSGSVTIQQQQIVSETGQAAVAEMGKMLATFRESGVQVWLTATATCETYLRCQVYHSSMENDWDLQAVPIAAAKAPIPGLFPRIGGNGVLGSSVESLKPLKGFPMIGTTLSSRRLSENKEPARGVNLCPTCTECYERELAKLVSEESEKSSSPNKSEMRSPLPQWMQIAKLQNGGVKVADPPRSKDLELNLKRITEELQKKWTESCRQLHPRLHPSLESERPATANSMMSMYNSNLLKHQQFQPKLQQIRSPPTLQLSHTPVSKPSELPALLPESHIRTDLALGGPNVPDNSVENTHKERIKDFSGCIPSEWQPEKFSNHHSVKQATLLDADSFKSLFKGLTERVAWQTDAASAIATTIIQCRSGNPKRHGAVSKGDTWMLFLGPDKVGKRKMASALSELVCRQGPITISLTSGGHDDNESELRFRGKTVLDRIAEAVRRNPLSVVILNDIDQADMLVHGCIKRAIERGRLTDSHGREIGLGSVIFILTADWLPENVKPQLIPGAADEEKMAAMADLEWQLQLSIVSKMCKRRADWVSDCERFPKPRKESPGGVALSFDLNMAVETEEEVQEGSRNSSDLTVELEHEQKWTSSTMSLLPDLVDLVDDSIAFKAVDFGPLRSKVASTIVAKFAASVGEGRTIEVDQEAIDRIVGGVWFGRTQLEEWVDRVLVPSFQQLSSSSPADADNSLNVVRLSLLPDMPKKSCSRDWLPEKITVVADRR